MKMRKRLSIPVIVMNYIAAIVFLLSVCAMDSDTNLFYVTAIISGAWLAFVAYKCGLLGGDIHDVD